MNNKSLNKIWKYYYTKKTWSETPWQSTNHMDMPNIVADAQYAPAQLVAQHWRLHVHGRELLRTTAYDPCIRGF